MGTGSYFGNFGLFSRIASLSLIRSSVISMVWGFGVSSSGSFDIVGFEGFEKRLPLGVDFCAKMP